MFFRYFNCIIYFLAVITILYFPTTDADLADSVVIAQNKWTASSLELKQSKTINNQNLDYLFNVTGLQAPGLITNSFRLKSLGNSNVTYGFTYTSRSPDPKLCTSLNLKLIHASDTKYSGPLSQFKLENIILKDSQSKSDWIALLSLDDTSPALQNLNCSFDIVITSRSSANSSGFVDREILTSSVTTSLW